MDKDKQKDFARRISQANRTELVVVTYEIIIWELKDALNEHAAGNKPAYRESLKRAQRFLGELMNSLDFRYPIALKMMSLYEYVQRVLIGSDVSGENRGIESAVNVLSGLRDSFEKISANDNSGPVMENAQSIYAGLTYGRGHLNETNVADNMNRGFLA